MKIERINAISESIESFAYVYTLTMVITRVEIYNRYNNRYRYYASFKDVKVMTNSGTAFIQGTGLSEKQAIEDYARHIKLHKMILPKGHTINVWNLQ
ncbi:hypothetical protein LCGC14_0646430 [marine sediment metagenome]|uniref:Uncharacterized protein n=1 Tax=marine sediment metagenome TaxID=412755 RepID=A0A0F9U5Z0_9ZZZZ